MKFFIALIVIVLAASLIFTFTTREKKGLAQKAGEKIDQGVEKTTETLNDTAKKVEEGLKQ